MTNPYPLPRETRETSIMLGDGRATYGPFGFKIWDTADIVAIVDRGSGEFVSEAVTAAKAADQIFDDFTVTFSPPLLGGHRALIQSRRLHERSTDVTRGGAISTLGLEGELSRQGTVLQELRRDSNAAENATRTAAAAIIELKDKDEDFESRLVTAAEAEAAKADAQQAAALAATSAVSAVSSALAAEGYATAAAALVEAADAGFGGFASDTAYDFGFVADPVTYFDQDFGELT